MCIIILYPWNDLFINLNLVLMSIMYIGLVLILTRLIPGIKSYYYGIIIGRAF